MIDSHGLFLLVSALCSVIALVLLIAVGKLNPFLVLFLTSLGLAALAGMPLETVVRSFELGLGSTLGHITIVIALGTMLGKMMTESGAADRIAETLIRLFGPKRVPWSMLSIGILIGLPVFFEVGFVLLVPIAFTVARRSRSSLVLVGLPLVTGLSVVQGLAPPHPAPLMAVAIYHADMGRTIFYALLIGIPTAVIAGPLYARWIAPAIRLDPHNPMAEELADHHLERRLPPFPLALGTILLPVLLMLAGSWADSLSALKSTANHVLHLLGNPDIALLAGVMVSFVTLGKMQGFSRETILKFSNECLGPTATITLLVGGGGGFGRILEDSGVSQAIIQAALHAHISILFLAWVVAALIRLATGSATVAMATAAGIIAPLALHGGGVHPELLVIATGAGSLVFSHVNDGGFWLVKEYFNMSVAQTIQTWSVCETLISVIALLLTVALAKAV